MKMKMCKHMFIIIIVIIIIIISYMLNATLVKNVPDMNYLDSLFSLRFYGQVNPIGSCRALSVYLATLLLGRHSPISS